MDSSPLSWALEQLQSGRTLSAQECRLALGWILEGNAPDGAVGAFLTALHQKGESAEELEGAVLAIRQRMIPFETGTSTAELMDTCGTGGDGAGTVNISSATAIVLAACGVRVVKHGNRAATGRSGSSEVLDELGVATDVDPTILLRCLEELGICFLFAPLFHPGLRRVAAVRRQLPFRTIFNLVGPLCNPARPTHQLIGLPREDHARAMALALARAESIRRAVVVTGCDGLDEVTLDGPTLACIVEPGSIREEVWMPESFNLPRVPSRELFVSGPKESALRLLGMLQGEPGPVRQIVLANAAAALWTLSPGPLAAGVDRAAGAIDSGAAARLLTRWSLLTRGRA
jgi:anthranilate phosphoribosyltransferase